MENPITGGSNVTPPSIIGTNGSNISPSATSNIAGGSDWSTMELPKYKCYKEVWALKIKEINLGVNEALDAKISFEDEKYPPTLMPTDWIHKHTPQIGGYYMVYKDGYRSYSPAKAFEEGYTKI